jgi:hypothetical protein
MAPTPQTAAAITAFRTVLMTISLFDSNFGSFLGADIFHMPADAVHPFF